MINNVVLVGRLTKDVELRYTPANQAVATFTLADRSTQVYPVLIGRATLNGKFIVDVQKGVATSRGRG